MEIKSRYKFWYENGRFKTSNQPEGFNMSYKEMQSFEKKSGMKAVHYKYDKRGWWPRNELDFRGACSKSNSMSQIFRDKTRGRL